MDEEMQQNTPAFPYPCSDGSRTLDIGKAGVFCCSSSVFGGGSIFFCYSSSFMQANSASFWAGGMKQKRM